MIYNLAEVVCAASLAKDSFSCSNSERERVEKVGREAGREVAVENMDRGKEG